jgi:predicted acylesterase/phospholipase RssA
MNGRDNGPGTRTLGLDGSRPDVRGSEGPRIGLALSGGGFRATAFGLGTLRALHDRGILRQVSVVSGISGGSLLAAMWAYGPSDFDEFDATVVEVMRGGLQIEIARRLFVPAKHNGSRRSFAHGRTEALIRAFATRPFGAKTMDQVTHPGLATVISATDLTTTNAVRFGSEASSCSPYGRIQESVPVAEAVAASAAFPILLPALKRRYTFERRDGTTEQHDVALTDGGVYDNLGLSVLLPGRLRQFTSHVYELDYVVAVDAGRGRPKKAIPNVLPLRLARSFDITYAKTQDGNRARLNAEAKYGSLQGFVHPYLAMPDHRLPRPLADFVPRSEVAEYPTNFTAVGAEDLLRLTQRGEQLTRVLLARYCPELG